MRVKTDRTEPNATSAGAPNGSSKVEPNSSPAMSSARRKGKMKNVASFINDHIDIVGTSILGIVLLVLEKLMDLEFKCPAPPTLAMFYSLVFLVIPTIIVGLVVGKVSPKGICCKIKSATEEDNGEANTESNKSLQDKDKSETKTETKQTTCLCACIKKCFECIKSLFFWIRALGAWILTVIKDRRCSADMDMSGTECLCACIKTCFEFIKSQFFWIKAVGAWILIVITDGRYFACLETSVDLMKTNNSNGSWTDSYSIQKFQMSGLILILIVVFVYLYCKKTCCKLLSWLCKSSCCKKPDGDISVENLLSREDGASYDPESPNAREELEKVTARRGSEVKRPLKNANNRQHRLTQNPITIPDSTYSVQVWTGHRGHQDYQEIPGGPMAQSGPVSAASAVLGDLPVNRRQLAPDV